MVIVELESELEYLFHSVLLITLLQNAYLGVDVKFVWCRRFGQLNKSSTFAKVFYTKNKK